MLSKEEQNDALNSIIVLETENHNLKAGIYKYKAIIKALFYMREKGLELNLKEIEIIEGVDLANMDEFKPDEIKYTFMDWVNKLEKNEWEGVEEFHHWFKYTARTIKQYELAETIGIDATHLSQVLLGNLTLTTSLRKHLINFRKEYNLKNKV